MAEPTEAEQETARKIMGFRPRQTSFAGWDLERATAIAQALANERERARAPFVRLFSGGPDTPCRTTWPKDGCGGRIECVEVPMSDLRAAFEETGQ